MMTYKEAMRAAEGALSLAARAGGEDVDVRVAEGYLALAREIRECGTSLSAQEYDNLMNMPRGV